MAFLEINRYPFHFIHTIFLPLQHLHRRIRRELFENLRHIDLGRAISEAAVPENRAERLLLRHGIHHAVRDILVEAGHQGAMVIVMHRAAVDGLRPVRQRQRQPPLQEAAEKEIQIRAVLLDIAFQPVRKLCSYAAGA